MLYLVGYILEYFCDARTHERQKKATYILPLLTETFTNTKTIYSSSAVYLKKNLNRCYVGCKCGRHAPYVCLTRIIMRVILSTDLMYIFYNSTRHLGQGKYSKIPFFCGFGNLFVQI
jgi:hypothetical protein